MSDDALIQLPIGGGLDESADVAFTPPPKLRAAQNVIYPDANTVSKRNGYTTLATLANAKKLVARANDVLVIDGVNAWSYSPSAGALVQRGRVSPCMPTRTPLASGDSTTQLGAPQGLIITPPLGGVAEGNGFRVRIWSDGLAVVASVWDVAGETYARAMETLRADAGDGSGNAWNQPRIVVVGTTAIALYYRKASGVLTARTLNLANVGAGWSGETNLVSVTAGDACVFDATPVTDGGTIFAVLLCDPAGSVSVYTYSAALAIQHSKLAATVSHTSLAFSACAIRAVSSDNALAIAYGYNWLGSGFTNYELDVATYSVDLGTTLAAPWQLLTDNSSGTPPPGQASSIDAIGIERVYGTGAGNTSQFLISWTRREYTFYPATAPTTFQSTALPATYYALWNANNNLSSSNYGPEFGWQMQSKPFAVTLNGALHVLMLVMYGDPAQPTQELVDLVLTVGLGTATNWTPLATVAPRFSAVPTNTTYKYLGGVPPARASGVTNIGNPSATVFETIATYESEARSESIAACAFDFGSASLWQSVKLGDLVFVAGGLPMFFDGSMLAEVGFIHAPPQLSVANITGSGSVPAGNVSYVAVYAQADSQGNIHRSQASTPVTIASAANSTNNVYAFPYRTTLRQTENPSSAGAPGANPVYLEIYRNTQATPSVYQLLTTLQNDPTQPVQLQVFADTHQDADIATNPILYSQGSVPSECPPALSALAVHADRLFGVAEDGRTMYFTTPLTQGEAPRFTDAFTITWPDGPLTAAWSLEGRLHAATASSISFIYGDGPSDTGAGSDFSAPQQWQSSIGVVDPRCVADCEPGIVFYSAKGLYLQTRASEIVWVGEKVRTTIATFPTCTGIEAIDSDGVVRATFTGTLLGTPIGVTLHWDYRRDRWAQHYISAGGFSSQPTVSACVAAQYVALVQVNGGTTYRVMKEDETTYLDDGAWVTLLVQTAPVQISGLQGSWRIRRVLLLGSSQTAHGITIKTFTNYSSTADSNVGTWSDQDIAAMTIEQMRHSPSTQKGMAFQVQISDAAPTTNPVGTGQGPLLRGVLLRGHARRGEFKSLTTSQQR